MAAQQQEPIDEMEAFEEFEQKDFQDIQMNVLIIHMVLVIG